MSMALQQLIDSQRMLLNALESMINEPGAVSVKEPKIVHAHQDEMSPEEELEYVNYVEEQRLQILRQAGKDKRTLESAVEEFEYASEEIAEEPVLLQHVVGTMDRKDTTRGLDQADLMESLNL